MRVGLELFHPLSIFLSEGLFDLLMPWPWGKKGGLLALLTAQAVWLGPLGEYGHVESYEI